jgi:hypothetical protein
MARYIRLHEALVSFWAERLPDRVHILDYEALTEDPEPVIRDLSPLPGCHGTTPVSPRNRRNGASRR